METGDEYRLGDSRNVENAPPPESFFVRFWVEPEEHGGQGAAWTGRITHVTSRESRHFRDLGAIAEFIRPLLARSGVRFRPARRFARWLKR